MRKIDGLKFLQKNFPDLTVDCLFVDKVENLDETEIGLGGFGSTGVSENKTPNMTAKEILENNIESKPKNKSKFK